MLDILLLCLNPMRNQILVDVLFSKTMFETITKGWHRDETLNSGYIYQMYTYLRSQERDSDPRSQVSAGMLLHPTVDMDVTENVIIQGHPIWFCTVNLDSPTLSIRKRLLSLCENVFL